MEKDQLSFLSVLNLEPVILDMAQTCYLLNIHIDAGLYLVRVGHLEPLGSPPPGAQKYFATKYIKGLADNEQWLNKAARLIRQYHRTRNGSDQPAHALNGNAATTHEPKRAPGRGRGGLRA